MTDYNEKLGSSAYTGQIELYFDRTGESCALFEAQQCLIWTWRGKTLGYFPKK